MSQLSLDLKFSNYHEQNPQIYSEFEKLTLRSIAKGFKNYGAKGIFELLRWHTGVRGNDQFKVNNIYTPLYARLFEEKHPEHKGFFRQRKSKFDKQKFSTSV